MTLRVVAGSLRGRRLDSPSGEATRPTSDRAREATFNSLNAQGLLHGAVVLDLFAGSGAMGIEALSRGAEHVTFVDSSAAAVAVVQQNVNACALVDRAEVVRSPAATFLRSSGRSFDMVLMDPPYGFEKWKDTVAAVDAATLVIESDGPVADPGSSSAFGDQRYEVIRERRYGTTVVAIAVQTS